MLVLVAKNVYLLPGAFNICSGWRLGGRHRKRSAVHIVFVERIERGSVHIVFVERALPAAPPLSLTGASRLLTLVETSVGAATPRRLEPGMWSALWRDCCEISYIWDVRDVNQLYPSEWAKVIHRYIGFATWTSLRIEWFYRQARRTEERVSRQGCRGGCCGVWGVSRTEAVTL